MATCRVYIRNEAKRPVDIFLSCTSLPPYHNTRDRAPAVNIPTNVINPPEAIAKIFYDLNNKIKYIFRI